MDNKIIVFEGIDGSGKSTQVKLTKEWLEAKGYKVETLADPGGTMLGDEIRNLLLHKKDLYISQYAEFYLFMASRANLVDYITSFTDTIFLIDRFWYSTFAYQVWANGIDIDLFLTINDKMLDHMQNIIGIYIDVPMETALNRVKGHDKMEDKYLRRILTIKEAYDELIDHGYLHKLNGRGNPTDVNVRVKLYLNSLMKGW
jgi:dTMP kinase